MPEHRPLKVLVAVVAYNEGDKLKQLVRRFPPDPDYELLFVDDGSTDDSPDFIRARGHQLLRHAQNLGVGAAIRDAISYATQRSADAIVIMSGNGKMQPEEIPLLVEPIRRGMADYVQGSRYLKGGRRPNLPAFRNLAIRAMTLLANLALGFRGTDVTCGFRAYRLDLIDRCGVNIDQPWLNRYEMEYYLHIKFLRCKLRTVEVPVSMAYPKQRKNYSKIRPFSGWWSMLRPWVFLLLRIKK